MYTFIIDPNAYNSGKPLFGMDPAEVKVTLGFISGKVESILGRNTLSLDDALVENYVDTSSWREHAAQLIIKGVIVVKKNGGAALTALQMIRTKGEVQYV